MRIFYDDYSPPRRAELVLLASDFVAVAVAVTFASGSAYFGRGPIDALLLAAWAAAPRAIAQFLDWLGRPRDFVLSVLLSTGFVVFAALLLLAGLSILLDDILPAHLPLRAGVHLVVIATWLAGFLLCRPSAYRLHDFLLASLMLLGLLQRMPHSTAWLAVFLVALFSSLGCRHLVLDVFPGHRKPPVNLQNVRWLVVLATACVLGGFVLTRAVTTSWIDSEQPNRFVVDLSRWAWNPWGRNVGEPGQGRRETGEPDRFGDPTSRLGRDGATSGDDSRRTIGFTHRVRLRDLVAPRYDSRVVLIARPASDSAATRWRPSGHTLWKALAFSTFDAASGEWEQDARYRREDWPETERVRIDPLERGAEPDDAGLLRLELEVALPAFRNLVHVYDTVELGPVRAGPRAEDPRKPPDLYLTNSFGDVFPYPPLIGGSVYEITFRASSPGRATPPGHDSGAHADPRFLEFPSVAETGVDLEAYALGIVGSGGSVRSKTLRLLAFYEREFRRSDIATWTATGSRHLAAFLETERIGDCTFYSTASALLLRAAGVSTRLVVGFVGGERRPDGSVLVRNARAHAWIEVYQPSTGWHPVDPTAWAPMAEDGAVATPDAPDDATPPLPIFEGDDLADDEPVEPLEPLDGLEDPELVDELEPESPAPPEEDALQPAEIAAADDGDGAWILGGELDPTALLDSSDAGAAATGASEDVDASGRSPLSARSVLLRGLVALLVGAAAFLALLALLRPRRRRDAEAGRAEEEPDAIDPLGADLSPAALDEVPSDPAAAVVFEYQLLQRDLSRTRNHRLPHQTPIEHGRRFAGASAELDEAFRVLHGVLYSVLYGRRRPRETQLDEVRRSGRRVRRHLG